MAFSVSVHQFSKHHIFKWLRETKPYKGITIHVGVIWNDSNKRKSFQMWRFLGVVIKGKLTYSNLYI